MIYIGIDPGISGAVAIIDHNMEYWASRLWSESSDIVVWLENALERQPPDYTVLEDVNAYPAKRKVKNKTTGVDEELSQGISSTSKFIRNAGWWEGGLDWAHFKYKKIRPQEWQKSCGVVGKKKDPMSGLNKARELFPTAPLSRKKDSGVADALLMARYALILHRQERDVL